MEDLVCSDIKIRSGVEKSCMYLLVEDSR